MKARVLNCSIIILLILLFSISGNSPARAAPEVAVVFNVDNMFDGEDDDIDGNCFSSAQSGCTLRAALQEASSAVKFSNVTINMPDGYYVITIPKDTTGPDGSSGDLDLDPLTEAYPYRITIQRTGDWFSQIDANGFDRALHIGAYHKVTLIRIRITGGFTSGMIPSLIMGAGITAEHDSEVTLDRVKIYNNEVNCEGGGTCRGGGIATNNANLTIQDSEIDHNTAGQGSAIYTLDDAAEPAYFTDIRNSTIRDNVTTEYSAIHSFTELRLINTTMYDNSGPQGSNNIWAAGPVWIQNSTLGYQSNGHNVFCDSSLLHIRNSILVSVPGIAPADPICMFQPGMPGAISEGGNVFTDPSCSPLPALNDVVIPAQEVLLAGLMNNGAPTGNGGNVRTMMLLTGSPAIDRRQGPCMVNQLVDGLPQELPLLEDARQFPRFDGKCDAGAVEISYFTYLPIIQR